MRHKDDDALASEAISLGLRYISRSQTPLGSFPVRTGNWTANDQHIGSPGRNEHCIYGSALVLECMNVLEARDYPVDRAMMALVRRHLLAQAEHGGLYRYPISGYSLPPDVDDTCCASSALKSAHPRFLWRENANAILTARNSTGVFGTWIGATGWPDMVDVGVNANALLYLGDRNETLSAASFVSDSMTLPDPTSQSPYYPNLAFLSYLVLRAYLNGARTLATAAEMGSTLITPSASGRPFSEVIATCVNMMMPTSNPQPQGSLTLAHRLCGWQQTDGSWPFEVLYRSRDENFGHEVLTTAVCLEALARFARPNPSPRP
jgi:hypothetical protein